MSVVVGRRALLRGTGAAVIVGGATPLWAQWLASQWQRYRSGARVHDMAPRVVVAPWPVMWLNYATGEATFDDPTRLLRRFIATRQETNDRWVRASTHAEAVSVITKYCGARDIEREKI